MDALRWDDLRVLLAVFRQGSLKRAARDLGVNISTVSRRLDALEATTRLHLFDRAREGTLPTAAAERLLPFAERMEHAAQGLAQGLQSLEAEPEGGVRLTAPPGFVHHFLAPRLGRLCDAYPRLRVQVIASIGYADLTRQEADLALRIGRPEAGDFVTRQVATHGWAVVAAPAHAAALGSLRDPAATRWVTWGPELAHLPDRQWVDSHVPRGCVRLLTSSMTAQIEAVRSGYGVMLAPAVYAELPGLCAVACSRELRKSLAALPRGSLWLVTHRALREVPRIAVVWSWLEKQFEAQARTRGVGRPSPPVVGGE